MSGDDFPGPCTNGSWRFRRLAGGIDSVADQSFLGGILAIQDLMQQNIPISVQAADNEPFGRFVVLV